VVVLGVFGGAIAFGFIGLFVGRLVAENGQIKLLRESINLVELALAIHPNGLAEYKVPAERQRGERERG